MVPCLAIRTSTKYWDVLAGLGAGPEQVSAVAQAYMQRPGAEPAEPAPMPWRISVGLAATPGSSTRLPNIRSTSANSVRRGMRYRACCTTPAKPTWLICRAH